MANADRNRKLFVRSVLVTGSTIATLVGAQGLIMLDVNQANAAAPAQEVLVFPDQTQSQEFSTADNSVITDQNTTLWSESEDNELYQTYEHEDDDNTQKYNTSPVQQPIFRSRTVTSSRPFVQRSRSSR